MSKKARLRKANRRRFESWWKSRNYRGVADMVKDFYDIKGKEYRALEDGIVFKTESKIWQLQNHPRSINGTAVWGVGMDLKSSRFCSALYIDWKRVEYLHKKARAELFKLWNENNIKDNKKQEINKEY